MILYLEGVVSIALTGTVAACGSRWAGDVTICGNRAVGIDSGAGPRPIDSIIDTVTPPLPPS